MKAPANNLPQGMIEALIALHGPNRPLTDIESARYNSARAAEMARAEARRQLSPQLDLDAAA
jgi:hypothetical protein